MPAETTAATKTGVASEATVDATTLGEGRHQCQRGHQRRNQN
jgi:hypothetical protein